MKKLTPLENVIDMLDLISLTGEGGLWAQGSVSDEVIPGGQYEGRPTERPLYGTIYYLLTPGSSSRMHKLTTDEVWYYHCGPAVNLLLIYPDGSTEVKTLGADLLNGELPQIMVPRGVWQGAVIKGCDGQTESTDGVYTLMSTSMAPAYCDSDFETAGYEELKEIIVSSCGVIDPIDKLLKILTQDAC